MYYLLTRWYKERVDWKLESSKMSWRKKSNTLNFENKSMKEIPKKWHQGKKDRTIYSEISPINKNKTVSINIKTKARNKKEKGRNNCIESNWCIDLEMRDLDSTWRRAQDLDCRSFQMQKSHWSLESKNVLLYLVLW